MKQYIIKENEAGQRFDKYLMKLLKQAPSSFVYKMLRKKNITLNGKKADGNEKLTCGDEIKLFFSDESFDKLAGAEKQVIDVPADVKILQKQEIVYEDDNVIIVNKPVGELSQKAEKNDVSINERILFYLKNTSSNDEAFTPSICNRLDRNTSGLIIAGKSLKGLQDVAELLKTHELKKYYLCVVQGTFNKQVDLTAYIIKNEKDNKVTVYDHEMPETEKIMAEYIPLISSGGYTLLAVNLKTGKPHQIRAHLSYLGFVLLGDKKYGYKPVQGISLSHQLLHAFMLIFPDDVRRLSDLQNKVITCNPPKEFMHTAYKLFGNEEVNNAILEFERTKGFRT